MPNGNRPNTRHNSVNSDNLSIDEKLNLLLTDVGQIKSDNRKCLSDISAIKDELTTFKEDINKTIDMCFEQIKECKVTGKKNSSDISNCIVSVNGLESENVALRKRVSELGKKLATAEQYSRSNCLEIVGVPEANNENIIFVIRQISAVLNFKFEDSMVDAVHRLSKNPNKPTEPRGIIVKFCRRRDMEEMRRRSLVKKPFPASELGFNSSGTVYINLSLTKESRVLWAEVRSFRSRNNYKYAWITSAGKMFLRKDQGHAAILVNDRCDLNGLG